MSQQTRGIKKSFIDDISHLVFVVHNSILGDAAKTVITSLVEEFNKIVSHIELTHNLELSQFFPPGNGIMTDENKSFCEHCELVLKYIDTSVCIHDGKAKMKYFEENGMKYDINKWTHQKQQIECQMNRGIVCFFVRQKIKHSHQCFYEKIKIVKIHPNNDWECYKDAIYLDNDYNTRLQIANESSIARSLELPLKSASENGQFKTTTSNESKKSTSLFSSMLTNVKSKSAMEQKSKLQERSTSAHHLPSEKEISTANTVVETAKLSSQNENLMGIIVPAGSGVFTKEGGTKNDLGTAKPSIGLDTNIVLIEKDKIPSSIPVFDIESLKRMTYETLANLPQLIVKIKEDLGILVPTNQIQHAIKDLNEKSKSSILSSSLTGNVSKLGKDVVSYFETMIKKMNGKNLVNGVPISGTESKELSKITGDLDKIMKNTSSIRTSEKTPSSLFIEETEKDNNDSDSDIRLTTQTPKNKTSSTAKPLSKLKQDETSIITEQSSSSVKKSSSPKQPTTQSSPSKQPSSSKLETKQSSSSTIETMKPSSSKQPTTQPSPSKLETKQSSSLTKETMKPSSSKLETTQSSSSKQLTIQPSPSKNKITQQSTQQKGGYDNDDDDYDDYEDIVLTTPEAPKRMFYI